MQINQRLLFNGIGVVEKPRNIEAPSNIAIGELSQFETICAYRFDGKLYDVGDKLGFNIEHN